jgi:hypothetical protein
LDSCIDADGRSLGDARLAGDDSSRELIDYFRLPAEFGRFEAAPSRSDDAGFFRFGDSTCFGRVAHRSPSVRVSDRVPAINPNEVDGFMLPFDLSEVITNLRRERYAVEKSGWLEQMTSTAAAQALYYALRPMLPVPLRKHLQRIRLRGWDRIPFPSWPIDDTVDRLMETSLALLLKNGGVDPIPFIWFWPDGRSSALIMTHDVESASGAEGCDALMDLDDEFGFKAAFQLIPEVDDGGAWSTVATRMRARGFEVNLHDLTHDGSLFRDRSLFVSRAAQINGYASAFQCRGFRSGAMYRQQDWFSELQVSYDMSVPNVAHLEPQRGGCCTVMPYFIGGVLELPLTTAQDYSLFHVIGDYSLRLWTRQIEAIVAKHGLLTFLAHPDYLADPRARRTYVDLLTYLSHLRGKLNLWCALPGDVDQWWRSRQGMKLVRAGESWRVVGPESARARVAWASLDADGRVVYRLGAEGRRPA